MHARSYKWLWVIVPALLAVWLLRSHPGRTPSQPLVAQPLMATGPMPVSTPTAHTVTFGTKSASTMPVLATGSVSNTPFFGQTATNKFAWRLTNTRKTLNELAHDSRGILLANALIDTRAGLNFTIPKKLQAQGDPGAYVVQANGPIGAGFRSMLAAAGVQIVSYIPNNALLVQATAGQVAGLANNALTAAVVPYEPYYKASAGLMALEAQPDQMLPLVLNLGLFPNADSQVISQLAGMGVQIVGEDRSPFGTILRVATPADWTTLAQLPGVHELEIAHRRTAANDLSRVTMGISTDTLTNADYLGLYGSNVVVEVNDSGIDVTHPDFTLGGSAETGAGSGTRVYGDSPGSLTDTNGHGTFVAGIIAGNGAGSWNPVNVGSVASGSISNADFRGKAPLAYLYSVAFRGGFSIGPNGFDNDYQGAYDPAYDTATANQLTDVADVSDYYLSTAAVALTNALISNNSWTYGNDGDYDLASAIYDQATRDAEPFVPGSQPVLFVFPAGNTGYGNDNGSGGDPDSIESPGTAKNVITVGALQQDRNITNLVYDDNNNTNPIWQAGTESSSLVAWYSSRGNVGIGVEGSFGRFKPDVMAPGTFVVSTKSSQWNQVAYYNPTNYSTTIYQYQTVNTNTLGYYYVAPPPNTVGININVQPVAPLSPTPFPNMPIYLELDNPPDPVGNPGNIDITTLAGNAVYIPPDTGGNITGLQSVLDNGGVWVAVGDGTTNNNIYYNLVVTLITTNLDGDYFEVLSNMNVALGPYYRYETGTSMSAAAVSGMLALMQDFFTNTLHETPSPALLKAMLINGAQSVAGNQFTITNSPNFQGWGLASLPYAIPPGLTNLAANPTNVPMYFLDQSPANALATGDSQTFNLTVSPSAQPYPLRVTLVWTDPPGDPAAAIKLVNNLDVIVTNLDATNTYYGNNFSTVGTPSYSLASNSNYPPNIDVVNNVRNILLQPPLSTNYTVTVLGREVNVNAVTLESNNVVQDFALVLAGGDGSASNGISVVSNPVVSNPTGDQNITIVTSTNVALMNQFAGENSPLLGTNTVGVGTNSVLATNGLVTVGQTNQWHFYVVTNTTGYTNVAFITFNPDELAISPVGTLAGSTANATRPEGDIDLYVSSEATLTNLDPVVISNCVNGVRVGTATFNDEISAGPGGTEFVAYSNSVAGNVYYIGVKSEDHLGTEYGFLPVFSQYAFSSMNSDGSESVNGLTLPVPIPVGSPQHASVTYIFALALYPMTVDELIVTNGIYHQNFGNLYGQLSHNDIYDVLNNHDALGNTTLTDGTNLLYYDSTANPINTPIGPVQVPLSALPSDGPGSLTAYQTQQAIGPWILTEADNVPIQNGEVTDYGLRIYPHVPPQKGFDVEIAGGSSYYDYIDVPAGVTNLTLSVTNVTVPTTQPPLQVYLRFGATPVLPNLYDQMTTVSNGVPPGGSISVGPASIPPLQPGRYYYQIYNPSTTSANVYVLATLQYAAVYGGATFTAPTVPVPLQDDAAITNSITITNTETIFSAAVGVVVDSPRVSDLTLTLVSPAGQRYVLFENRGGDNATNLGHLDITTNFFGNVSSGGFQTSTNVIGPVPTQGILEINYNMYTVPDQLSVYYDGVLLVSNAPVSYTGQYLIPYAGTGTNISIVMNQYQPAVPVGSDLWTYTPAIISENYSYLTFTDDTNYAQVPIKFAIPPFDLTDYGTNYTLDDFELTTNGDYVAPTNIYDPNGGWTLYVLETNVTASLSNNVTLLTTNIVFQTNNEVSVVTDPANAQQGSNFLALANGTIQRWIPTIPERQYTVSYWYRGPGIAGWWRGEGNGLDSAYGETNGNTGRLIGRFAFPAGEVGQAFELAAQGQLYDFAGTNNYVQVPQSPALDVGTGSGMTVEGWINPTNPSTQEPVVEWLAHMPPTTTNATDTNLVIQAGPFLNRATGHYYYLLGQTNWTTSERWATNMGGHLVTINDANDQNWVFYTFAAFGGTNCNLWIGYNDAAVPGNFVWTSGETTPYANWLTGQPADCNGNHYAVMLGATNTEAGLWTVSDNAGTNFCGAISSTNGACGVVELDDIPTNGVQLWVSVTNSPATGNALLSSNGCLYANLVDTTNGFHELWSAPGLIQSNVFQHVALTYNTNTGVARLYYNGTNVCSTNLGIFTPLTTGDVLLGKDMSRATNNYFSGELDEMSVYGRCLSDAEILAIYNISALSTNGITTNGVVLRTAGKFDPAFNPAISLAEAVATMETRTNRIFGDNTNWQQVSYTFIADTNETLFQFTGVEPGILLDDFTVAQSALGNLYYQPEQPLDGLVGESAAGVWTLEILDNRAGDTNSLAQLVNWNLQFELQTNTPVPITLSPETPATNTVPSGDIAYFYVPVPAWATSATNMLVSSTYPVNLLYNATTPPTGLNPGDVTLLAAQNAGQSILTGTSVPPLPVVPPNNFYYLGVQNTGTAPATFVVQVNFNITALSNSVPVSDTLTTNEPVRYFSFVVSTNNPYEATFQLLQLTGNAELVVNYGSPLPSLTAADYGSFNPSNAEQSIYVLTNSQPVPLAPGIWYMGVFANSAGPVSYTVLAKELDAGQTNVITLTNNVPMNFTAGPGAALTNFFSFNVTNSPGRIHFVLYNLSGNGDLTVQTNALPLAPPWYQSSQEPSTIPEYIYLNTNSALSNLNAMWYLGVPNNETNQISFTILAVVDSNNLASFPGAVGAGGYTAGGRGSTNVYHVTDLNDDGPGSLRYGVDNLTNSGTIVFDVSGNIALQSPLVITNSYLTIAGQTAPGGGVTLQNYATELQGAHDVIIRYLRFRPGDGSNISTVTQAQFADDFAGPTLNAVWQPDLPNSAHSGSDANGTYSDTETYLGVPEYGFATLGTNSVLLMTNSLNTLQRVGWSTASSYTETNILYDVRFNTLTQSSTTSIDAFIEIWLLDASNPNNYDIISPFGGGYDGNKYFFVGSSIDGTYTPITFTYQNNTWYHLVLQCLNGQNIRASIYDDNGNELAGETLNHGAAAFPAGFQLGLSQAVGQAGGVYPEAVAVGYARLNNNNPGLVDLTPGDSLSFTNAYNVMIDHVSASWSTNAVLDVLNSTNVTVQWSVIADGLYKTNIMPGYGSLLRYGGGSLSFNHNLYANNYSASPLLGDHLTVDFVNNVVFDWGLFSGASTNDLVTNAHGATNELNYTCNYLLATTNAMTNYIAFWGGTTNTWIFQTNNFIDVYTNQNVLTNLAMTETNIQYVLNGANTGWSMFTNQYTRFGEPFVLPYPFGTNATLPTANAEEAYQACEDVLDFAGAQLARDPLDLKLVRDLRQQRGRFIASQNDPGVGGWPVLGSVQTPLDTDQDGMPDYWEITFGLNPTNAFDGANIVAGTGYTELETYLNWLAGPHALTVTNTPVNVDLYQLAGGTGKLTFFVTNALNGSVILTNDFYTTVTYTNGLAYTNTVVTRSNTIAIFTPTNNYYSSFTNPASFDFYVTNNDTVAWFGPVTVSVVVSATNIVLTPNIIVLTNGVPYTLTGASPGTVLSTLFEFAPTDSPGGVVFELYALSGDAGLVVQTNSLPVAPDYFLVSTNGGTNSVSMLVQTNPALSGLSSAVMTNLNQQWYLGVPNYSGTNLTYTIVAEELATSPNIITLTNNVPFTFTAGPGPDLTNFFLFPVSDSPNTVQFQLYGLSGNGGLTVQTNTLPFAPLFNWSTTPGNNPQLIQITTNAGVAGLNAAWYLGVPDIDPALITYTILAQEFTTNPPPGTLTNDGPQTIVVPDNSTNFYLINVPAYAAWATNTLISATGPVSVWYTTNLPPTAGSADDFELISSVTSGTNVFGTNSAPQLVPGGYYYLGVANTNTVLAVTNVIEVDFALDLPAPGAPVITNIYTTNLTATTATLGASVIPNGTNATVYFAYGLTTNYEVGLSPVVQLTNSYYSTWPVAVAITNLLPGNLYYYEAIATNVVGATTNNLDGTFNTPAALVSVTTEPATNITSTSVTLLALADPNGAVAAVYFLYGTDTTYGNSTSAVMLTNNLNLAVQVTNNVTGLLPGVIYHFEAVATNSLGTNYGGDLTFTNPPEPPSVTTLAATNNSPTDTIVAAAVLPNGAPTLVYFTYGLDTNYGSFSTAIGLTNDLNALQTLALDITNLLPGEIYHYEAVATNSAGTNYGGDLTFTNPAAAPYVTTLAATAATYTNIALPAQVTPNGAATTVYFVYGTTTNYGAQTVGGQLADDLTPGQLFTNVLAGLLPDVIYHYQAVATNSAGIGYGGDLTFTNPAATIVISSIIATNSAGTNGNLLIWYAPTNYEFKVQWTDATTPPTNWSTFTNIVVYTGPVTATNGLFSFFDNGSQTGGTVNPNRSYQLILWVTANNVPPVLPTSGKVYRDNPLTALVVTNTATDANTNALLTYTVTGSLAGTNPPVVNANGLITWTPTLAQAGRTNLITTIVSDNGQIPLTATNTFTVIVNPIPAFSEVEVTIDGVTLLWHGAAGNQYQIGWTTNLLTSWTYEPVSAPYLTSTTTNFFFVDTNALNGMKFYQLRQLP